MMEIRKKVISNLTKCYSIAPLMYHNEQHFLVAAEKVDRCLLFNRKGECVDTVWEEPGGVMSMVQIPGSDGRFLATHQFYSPNDSANAKIVIAEPKEQGNWEIRTLVELPFVHRFDIIERNGVNYLIACTLKSGHEYKDDWSSPGKVYAAVLPDNLDSYNEHHQLELTVIKEAMLRNHGYYKVQVEGINTAIISSENGVFQFTPPVDVNGEWEIQKLLDLPTSDAVLIDLDEDGKLELVTLSPFHGEIISIFKQQGENWEKVYEFPEKAEFLHALYGGVLCGVPAVVIGHRKGKRNLMAITYHKSKCSYHVDIIDENCGSANVAHFYDGEQEFLVAANREIDEVAMYIFNKPL